MIGQPGKQAAQDRQIGCKHAQVFATPCVDLTQFPDGCVDMREQFELLRGEDAITTYQFNTNVAKHTFCRHCGIHSFYVPRSAPDGVSVNARCLDGVDLDKLQPHPFDGRHWEDTMRARSAAGEA